MARGEEFRDLGLRCFGFSGWGQRIKVTPTLAGMSKICRHFRKLLTLTPKPHGVWYETDAMLQSLEAVEMRGQFDMDNKHALQTLRVQVPYNHILPPNLYNNYYYPKPKYLIIGYMDRYGKLALKRAPDGDNEAMCREAGRSLSSFDSLGSCKCTLLLRADGRKSGVEEDVVLFEVSLWGFEFCAGPNPKPQIHKLPESQIYRVWAFRFGLQLSIQEPG